MLGVLLDAGGVALGAVIGVLLKKGIPDRLKDAIMSGLALCCLYIGVRGIFEGTNTLILIISMVIGTMIGELASLDDKLNNLGNCLGKKLSKGSDSDSFSNAFVTTTLLFCVGAMAIVGSLQAGLSGNLETLYTKSAIDFVASIAFASALGLGVICTAASLLIYEGSITMLAHYIAPYLSDYVVAEMTCVGSLLIIAMSFNQLGLTHLKIMNFMPAMFMPIILCMFM